MLESHGFNSVTAVKCRREINRTVILIQSYNSAPTNNEYDLKPGISVVHSLSRHLSQLFNAELSF